MTDDSITTTYPSADLGAIKQQRVAYDAAATAAVEVAAAAVAATDAASTASTASQVDDPMYRSY
jgi:hypothetical protein